MITFLAVSKNDWPPILIYSLLAQKAPNWNLLIMHDEYNEKYDKLCKELNDPRIQCYFTDVHLGHWGHPMRQILIDQIDPNTTPLVSLQNCDNYLAPQFVQQMSFAWNDEAMRYCDFTTHGMQYSPFVSSLEYACIDIGCCVWDSHVIKELGWKSFSQAADWLCIQNCIDKYGIDKVKKIESMLFVHN